MIIVRTPLRVSLFGGGTDFPEYFSRKGGGVIGSSIDKYIYHTISPFPSWLFEHKIRFSYKQVEHVDDIEQLQHIPFREILRHHEIYENVEVNLASDLPSFTGLGSSSSFTVGLVKGLSAFKGTLVDTNTLAKTAIYLERAILKESVGFQDQIFASYGGFNHIKFYGANNFDVERLNINEELTNRLSSNLLMYYTGMTRKAVEIEKTKIDNLEGNMPLLDQMVDCVDQARNILSDPSALDDIGCLLNESWQLKRRLSHEVTNDRIDIAYEYGIENGALGGKLLGAGGGGFLLFYVPDYAQKKFREAFSKMHEVTFSLNAVGSTIIHAGS